MAELSDRYDFAATETEIYAQWLAAGCFVADPAQSARTGGSREPFTIVMPPPNVTAILHVGHGLNNTLQDVIIRWARMRGADALWVPGTDHAGIATQNVVEKLIAAEGATRFDLGREAFVRRTEDFVEHTGGVILEQLRAIGASADWTRTAYTLSPELSRAVREAFVRLYERGLVYRGHRVIHWCPRCLTSLSDEEAEFQEEPGTLYHVRYRLVDDPSRELVVATTRPETIVADVALAVHPEDDRYAGMVGTKVRLPIGTGIELPVIADTYVDPTFGTGVLKITPAHDANDYDVGRRHHLPVPVVIDAQGIVREVSDATGRVPRELDGLDRFAARERAVELLRASGALVRTQPHQHSVRHCYRCDTVVEPRLSDQWFVRMEPLAAPALAAVREGAIRILPERWEAVYVNWLSNIRDWNISRQLWWGHRIPVWYCDACPASDNIVVSREDPTACPRCGAGAGALRQDEDVLDTWFSSWLWPLSTLGWPDADARDLTAFYPTDVLVTAPEILFFWVSRMIMAGYAFMDRAPFHTVYLHGTARDTQHRKMSKSLGNGIDPMDVVRLYGADALRWTLVAGMGMGADVILDPSDIDKSFATGRNFATKLWNIGRFLLDRVGTEPVRCMDDLDRSRLTRADHWILARLDEAIADVDRALGPLRPSAPASGGGQPVWQAHELYAGLRLNEFAEAARRFVWNELADWYLESVKGRLETPGDDRETARAILVHAFDTALRMLHPVVPFVTESLWQRLPGRPAGAFLMQAQWPTQGARADARLASQFEWVREAVLAIRQIRGDNAVAPSRTIDAMFVEASANGDEAATRTEERDLIGRLTRSSIQTRAITGNGDAQPGAAAAHALVAGGGEIVVPLAGLIDVEKECARLREELSALDKQIVSRGQRLENPKYLERAPANIVANDRATLDEMRARREQLAAKVASLCGL